MLHSLLHPYSIRKFTMVQFLYMSSISISHQLSQANMPIPTSGTIIDARKICSTKSSRSLASIRVNPPSSLKDTPARPLVCLVCSFSGAVISYHGDVGLDPVIGGVYRQTSTEKTALGGASEGERYWYDFRATGLNSSRFQEPGEIDLKRPTQLYSTLHGDGVFKTLGEDFVYKVAGQVLRAVFTRSNLTRATGSPGTLRRYVFRYLFVVCEC
jgi:hypothetical protein